MTRKPNTAGAAPATGVCGRAGLAAVVPMLSVVFDGRARYSSSRLCTVTGGRGFANLKADESHVRAAIMDWAWMLLRVGLSFKFGSTIQGQLSPGCRGARREFPDQPLFVLRNRRPELPIDFRLPDWPAAIVAAADVDDRLG